MMLIWSARQEFVRESTARQAKCEWGNEDLLLLDRSGEAVTVLRVWKSDYLSVSGCFHLAWLLMCWSIAVFKTPRPPPIPVELMKSGENLHLQHTHCRPPAHGSGSLKPGLHIPSFWSYFLTLPHLFCIKNSMIQNNFPTVASCS